MKALVCGDMHLKQSLILPRVAASAEATGASRIVFLGDYVDGPMLADDDQVEALSAQFDWAEEVRAKGIEVEFLMGNHDAAYLGGKTCSATMDWLAFGIAEQLERLELRVAATAGDILLAHAGVCRRWAKAFAPDLSNAEELAAKLNSMAADGRGMRDLTCVGRKRGGYEVPGPLWADSSELTADCMQGLTQIVAHSPHETCTHIDVRAEDGEIAAWRRHNADETCVADETCIKNDQKVDLWFCDTHAISRRRGEAVGDGSLLLIDGEEISVIHPEDFGYEPWKTTAKAWLTQFDWWH